MAYSFTGFFSKAARINQSGVLDGQVLREITEPFFGIGILTPGMTASFPECIKYLSGLDILDHDWIFLEYQTWAGPADYVIAIGSHGGQDFGPIEGDGEPAEDAFFEALDAFGLDENAGIIFAPFERGFWGNQ